MSPHCDITPSTTLPAPDVGSLRSNISVVQKFDIHPQVVAPIRTSLRLQLAPHIIEDQHATSGHLGLELVSSQLVDDRHAQLRDKKEDVERLHARAESMGDYTKVNLKAVIEYIAPFGNETVPCSKPDSRPFDPSGTPETWHCLAAFEDVKPQTGQGMARGQATKTSDALMQYFPIREKAKSLGIARDPLGCPSLTINCSKYITALDGMDTLSPLDRDREDWETQKSLTMGPFVWASISLLGRGTNIWSTDRIWRKSNRPSDSEIYESLDGGPDGVANFYYGGDAVFPWIATPPAIKAVNIRNTDYHINCPKLPNVQSHRSIDPTLMSHRLMLKTVGRPLWDAVDYIELLKGLRAALLGHEKSWKQGILHRDISARNILLAVGTAEEGEEGFITDFEFARLRQIRQTQMRVNDDCKDATAKGWTDTRALSGAIQFLAIAKLKATHSPPSVPGFIDQVHHDLESLIWVFAYAVMRRLMTEKRLDSDSTKHIHEWFKECFCSFSASVVASNRTTYRPLLFPCSISEDILPKPIKKLFAWFVERVQYNQSPVDLLENLVGDGEDIIVIVRPLTHKLLIRPIEVTISALSNQYSHSTI